MKKKFLMVILAASMISLSACGGSEKNADNSSNEVSSEGKAEDSVDDSDETEESEEADTSSGIEFNYEELSDGTLSIWFFEADESHKTIKIPEEIDGKKVSEIGDSLFEGNEDVEKVILPESITTILPDAFRFATSLKELEINGAVESVGVKAIYGCNELKTLKFPEGLKTLSSVSIAYCEKLADIYLPSTVESVESDNFTLCADPLTIHVPAGSTTETVVKEAIAENEYNVEVVAE